MIELYEREVCMNERIVWMKGLYEYAALNRKKSVGSTGITLK